MDRTGGVPGGSATAGGSATPATATIRRLAALFTGFAGPDELAGTGLLGGMDPAGMEVPRTAFAGPTPFTAEPY